MHASSAADLRHSIARIEGGTRRALSGPGAPELAALGHGEADCCLGGGLQRAAVHELFAASDADGPAASGFAGALARRTGGDAPLFWIRQDLCAVEWGELFAPGLAEFGLDPGRIVVVRVGQAIEALRAAWEALHCGVLGAVVVESFGGAAFDLTASRRLALAAERSGVTAILLRRAARPGPSAAETRWVVQAAPSRQGSRETLGFPAFDAALVRNRKGLTGRWWMEWDSDAYLFRAQKAHSLKAHSLPVDAPARHRPDPAPAFGEPVRAAG